MTDVALIYDRDTGSVDGDQAVIQRYRLTFTSAGAITSIDTEEVRIEGGQIDETLRFSHLPQGEPSPAQRSFFASMMHDQSGFLGARSVGKGVREWIGEVDTDDI